jgi:hypothetical protein
MILCGYVLAYHEANHDELLDFLSDIIQIN